jgi:hypothetical protein
MACLLLWSLMSFILSPLAILLTYRATNDIGLINMDVILSPFQNYFKNYFHQKNKYLSWSNKIQLNTIEEAIEDIRQK